MQRTCTCLWFNNQAQEAAEFYVSLFPDSRILDIKYYLEGAPMPAGTVLTVEFTLDGTEYMALNGGPGFTFSPAISIIAYTETQEEIDRLWEKLGEGGKEDECGWITDKYGLSWQITPRFLQDLLNSEDMAASQRMFSAMMKMKKLDIAALRRAYDGE